MSLFGMGPAEMAVVGVIALVIFGPKKLPELGGSIGKALRSFKQEMSTESKETATAEAEGSKETVKETSST